MHSKRIDIRNVTGASHILLPGHGGIKFAEERKRECGGRDAKNGVNEDEWEEGRMMCMRVICAAEWVGSTGICMCVGGGGRDCG